VSCGSIHTLARTNQQRIFSCGNGSTFALGHKSRDSCSVFKQIEFFNGNEDGGILGVAIKTIACGLSHSGCVLSDGSVYLWGITGDVQYSKEFMEKCLLKRPTRIQFRESNSGSLSHRRRSNATMDDSSSVVIEDLKLGEQFSMALSNKGQVYTWGFNDKGQLGLGNE
jgi:alpha-tubulin suppressor-like RCC1 family protein